MGVVLVIGRVLQLEDMTSTSLSLQICRDMVN